jgi:hypothetical protein
MTGADEIDIQKAEIRHQYNLMMELKAKMTKEKELLELQIRENYVLLIRRKMALYQQWMFGLVDFDKGIKMVQTYITKLNRKEITRRTKCEEKTYYELMKEHMESETGIKVKSIDEVVIYGYSWGYIIYFTDAKYNKPLRWYVPNLKHERYRPVMYYPITWGKDTTPNFDNLLDALDTKLCFVEERTEGYIGLEGIASFPDDIQRFEDFGKRLEERFGGEK